MWNVMWNDLDVVLIVKFEGEGAYEGLYLASGSRMETAVHLGHSRTSWT